MKGYGVWPFIFVVTVAVIASSSLSRAQDPGTGIANVLTWQNDTGRTGQNLNESTLLYSTPLSTSNFGQRCSAQLDGQVYAQPLLVKNILNSSGQLKNVVFVVTQNDSLYAFDGTPPASGPCSLMTFPGNPANPLPFLSSGVTSGHSAVDCHQVGHKDCGTIGPVVGILGTPVIVPANQKAYMYLVTETQTVSGTPPTQTYTFYPTFTTWT